MTPTQPGADGTRVELNYPPEWRGLPACWLVWMADPLTKRVDLLSVCTSESKANDTVRNGRLAWPGNRFRIERAPMNHAFGSDDTLLGLVQSRNGMPQAEPCFPEQLPAATAAGLSGAVVEPVEREVGRG